MTVKKKGKHTAIKSVDVIPTWVRMKDTRGKNNFKVFSVYDILNYDQKKRKEEISTKDFNRVLQVQTQSTKTLLGTSYSVEEAKEAISKAPGCRLVDDLKNHVYPMPLDTSDQDIVYVGRIRRDLTDDHGLNIWCCGDQVRKGAAANAVQIMELLKK